VQCQSAGGGGHTVSHIPLPHSAELRPIIHYALARPHKLVELYRAMEVHQTDPGQDRLSALGPDADHLAVERDIFTWSPQCVYISL
jgi:hypothetical protein